MSGKSPHDLWIEAKGDGQRYHQFMIDHGLLIDRTNNPPKPHLFQGKTLSCFCEECHGKFGASWHVAALTEAINKEIEKE